METVAEEVPLAPVLLVERLRIAAVQQLHPGGKLRPVALDDEVVMVAHQAKAVHPPPVAAHCDSEQSEEVQPVEIVPVDPAAVHSARAHVVDAVRK